MPKNMAKKFSLLLLPNRLSVFLKKNKLFPFFSHLSFTHRTFIFFLFLQKFPCHFSCYKTKTSLIQIYPIQSKIHPKKRQTNMENSPSLDAIRMWKSAILLFVFVSLGEYCETWRITSENLGLLFFKIYLLFLCMNGSSMKSGKIYNFIFWPFFLHTRMKFFPQTSAESEEKVKLVDPTLLHHTR